MAFPTLPVRPQRQAESLQVLNNPGLESNFDAQYAPIVNSHDQFGAPDLGFLQQTDEAVAPGTAAMRALESAANSRRQIALQDAMATDYDTMYRGPQRAQVKNQIADLDSEAAAGRQFLPNASRLYDRSRQGAMQDAYARYQLPAEINAQSDLDAAQIAGESRIEAARQRAVGNNGGKSMQNLLMSGLINAAQGQIEHGGKFDPEQLKALLQFLVQSNGIFEPQAPQPQ